MSIIKYILYGIVIILLILLYMMNIYRLEGGYIGVFIDWILEMILINSYLILIGFWPVSHCIGYLLTKIYPKIKFHNTLGVILMLTILLNDKASSEYGFKILFPIVFAPFYISIYYGLAFFNSQKKNIRYYDYLNEYSRSLPRLSIYFIALLLIYSIMENITF